MINIGSRTGHKIGILLILTTLAIGSAAGLSWNSPSTDSVIGNPAEINFSDSDGDSSGSYEIFYKSSGSSWNSATPGNVDDTGSSIAFDWDTTNLEGDYTLNITNANNYSKNITRNFTIDNSVPNVDGFTPFDGGQINGANGDGDDIDISYSSSDSPAGVEFQNISIQGESNSDNSSSLSGVSLSDGSYTVDYWVNDSVGNVASSSWSFTVDTTKDFSSSVSYSPAPGVVLMDGDKNVNVDLDSVNEYVTVTCLDSGGNRIGSDTGSSNSFTCEVDEDDYGDTQVDMSVEICDDAGNCETSSESTFNFDVTPPSVTGLEIPFDANLYNSNFDVEFLAMDSSGINEVEYYFDSDTNLGEGTDIGYSSDTDSYEIDTSSLSAGDHTLYVRAKDEASRWSSSPKTVDFSFDPDAVPEISLDIPENVSVTAGEQGDFDVTVENTGKLHISSMELSGSAEGVFSASQNISDLEPDESVTATLDIDTEASNIGEHTIEVSTDNPSKTKQVDLVVEANEEQQSQIDSDLSEYQSKLQDIESNVTELKQKVSEDKKQRLDSNFSTFKQKVEDAQSAVDRGDYYEAEAILEGVDQDQSAAQSSYEAVQKEYQNNQFWMFVLLGLGGFVVLVGGGIAALTYTDEVDFDIREYLEELQEIEVDTGFLEKYADKIKKMMEGKDTSDAEDFKWDGFDNK